jgi:hypothetical protein
MTHKEVVGMTKESRQEFFCLDKGTLNYIPEYGKPAHIQTWYFTIPGQEHVPGRYTLRWRQYQEELGVLQIKRNPYKFKLTCSLEQASRIFSLVEKTGDEEADAILAAIGSTKIVFTIASTREHFCEGPEEKIRVTCDRDVRIYSPGGNCLGHLPDRNECKIYESNLDEVMSKYNLVKNDSPVNKRIEGFKIVDQVKIDAFKLLIGRELEIKFDSKLDYEQTITAIKGLDFSDIKFIWQSFEHVEEDTHVYYRSREGAFRQIFKNGELRAIVRKSDKQAIDREESLCGQLPQDANPLGTIDRKKYKSYLVDTTTGHCFQMAVDSSVRHSDKAVLVQAEAEYIRSIYPWSREEDVISSLETLNKFLQKNLAEIIEPTLRRKIDFIEGK